MVYPTPYASGIKRRKRRRVRAWVLVLVLLFTAGGGMALLLQATPNSRVQAALPPATDNPELLSAAESLANQNKDVSRWTLKIENSFGTYTIADEEMCKKYRNWYEMGNRAFDGCGSPFDNKCTITFNDEPIAKFDISSDDSRVMRSEADDTYQILSDNIYDELQNALIVIGGSLVETDNPSKGRYTVPSEATSLAAFPAAQVWDTSGWSVVVENESGQTILTGMSSACQDLIDYVATRPTIATDPGEFDNRIWIVKDGKEMLRLYSAGGEVLLSEDQAVQMPFPETIANKIDTAMSAQANSLYEGGRFAFANASAAGDSNVGAADGRDADADTGDAGEAGASDVPDAAYAGDADADNAED